MRLLRHLQRDTDGTVTAEFAVTVPAVLLMLGIVVGSLQLSAERVALTGFAGELARLEARGDFALAVSRRDSFKGNPVISRSTEGTVLCITATSGPRAGLLATLSVSGSGCAALTR